MLDATAILERQVPRWLTQGTSAVLSGRSKGAIRDLCRKGVLRSVVPSSFTTRRVVETASLEKLMGRPIEFDKWIECEQRADDFYRSQPDNSNRAN